MNAVSLYWLLIVVIKCIYLVDANWITGNLCWSMPCMNGGSCFGSADTYLCICPLHYSGALCEKRLGVCQETPCGNRGLCIETSLISFECRCYFDYMGPTCEEHVKKNDPYIWSSLLPVHTRVLFDMLQEAYRSKSNRKSLLESENGQIDFIDLLSVTTTSIPVTSTTVETSFTTDQSETTEIEHIIQAHNIQLDKIFPDINTASTLDMNTHEFTEQSSQFDNPTTSETDINFTTMIIENIKTIAIEQIHPDSFNTADDQEIVNMAEQSNTMITSTPIQWSNDNNIIDDITTQNSIKETNNNPAYIIINTMKPNDMISSNIDIKIDDKKFYSSDQTMTLPINKSKQPSPSHTTAISQTTHSRLIDKLCKKLLSPILPNASSSSSKSLSNVVSSWFNKHRSSSISTTTTSTVPSLTINQIQTLSVPLKRLDSDDILHQMNNYNDDEH